MHLRCLALLGLLLWPACALPLQESGQIEFLVGEQPLPPQSGASFAWAEEAEPPSLETMNYRRLVAAALIAQGLKQVDTADAADLPLRFHVEVSPEMVQVPARRSFARRYERGYPFPITVCDPSGRVSTVWSYPYGYWMDVPVTIPAHEVRRHRMRFRLQVLDAQGQARWQGSVDTLAKDPAVIPRLRAWLPLLLKGFPAPATSSGSREVRIERD